MSDCCTCFGRGYVYGSDGKLKRCPNGCSPEGFTPEELFASLYRRYERMVRRIAAATLNYGDTGLVDDIAQDVWLQVWTFVQRETTTQAPAGLVATITRRMVGRHYESINRLKRPKTTPRDFSNGTTMDHPATASAEDIALAELSAIERLCAHLQAVTA